MEGSNAAKGAGGPGGGSPAEDNQEGREGDSKPENGDNVKSDRPLRDIDDVQELRGEQHASLRHLILHGHRPKFTPAYKTGAQAVVAAARGMFEAGCAPDAVIEVLLFSPFKISETVLARGKKALLYAGHKAQTALAEMQEEAETNRRQLEGAENPEAALVELNGKHFVSQESGKWAIYEEERDLNFDRIGLTRSSQTDFKLRYADRRVSVKDADGNSTTAAMGDWWISNSGRRDYDKIAFLPGNDTPPPSVYNLWRGFAVEPMEGDWSLLKDHILKIVCRGVEEYYDYYIKWMARKVQKPDEQGWSAIVMKGEEGVGKGIVVSNFGSLFGQHYIHISNSRHLVGNFNLHLRDCCVLFADEAYYAGDRQGEGTLKMLVTESEIPIEGKYRDVVMARNYIAIMMASNSEWMIPAGPTARRYFVLNVSNAKKGDHGYFRDIVDQMNNGGRQAMLHELLNTDLSGFNVRRVPLTPELLEQKLRSQSTEEAWWYDRLTSGRLLDGDDGWQQEVVADYLHDAYIKATGKTGAKRRATQTVFGMFLETVLPPGSLRRSHPLREVEEPSRHPHAPPVVKKKQVLCYGLPDLATCRQWFDTRAGQDHPWPRD